MRNKKIKTYQIKRWGRIPITRGEKSIKIDTSEHYSLPCPDCKNNPESLRPREWRLSVSKGPNWGPLKSLEDYSTIVLGGFKGTLNYTPIMPREAILSDSYTPDCCNFPSPSLQHYSNCCFSKHEQREGLIWTAMSGGLFRRWGLSSLNYRQFRSPTYTQKNIFQILSYQTEIRL